MIMQQHSSQHDAQMNASHRTSTAAAKKKIIFCDFDGTITENDNIVAIMRHFNYDGWEQLVTQVVDQSISIREGVGRMFALFPSAMKKDIVEYVLGQAKIRAGFPQLLEYCKQEHISFLVTSGGIDFFVYPLLAPFDIASEQIYCNASDFSGERIEILWPNACDEHCRNDCGMCKTKVIRAYPKEEYCRILIGDSVTDFEGAKLADFVFARSHLLERCKQLGTPYFAYETFHDVIEQLKKL